MSYSFYVREASKADAKAAVSKKLDEVVATQPLHAVDRAQAQAVADSFIDLLRDDPDLDIVINMNGSVSVNTVEGTATATSAAIGFQASLTARRQAT